MVTKLYIKIRTKNLYVKKPRPILFYGLRILKRIFYTSLISSPGVHNLLLFELVMSKYVDLFLSSKNFWKYFKLYPLTLSHIFRFKFWRTFNSC